MLDRPLPAPLMISSAAGDRSLCLLSQPSGDVIAIAYAIDSGGRIDQIAVPLRAEQVRQIADHLTGPSATAPASSPTPITPAATPRPTNGATVSPRPTRTAPVQRVQDRLVFALHEQTGADKPLAMIHTANCRHGLAFHTASASWLANYINRTPGVVSFCVECSPLGADTETVNFHIGESVPASSGSTIALDLTLAVLHRQAATLSERVEKR